MPLLATEIACKAKGDENCTFVMAPPHRMHEHVERVLSGASDEARDKAVYEIPTLFERKDVEERLREAVARAQAANEAKTLFLANMSHEIRTPLTGILGMAHLLLDSDLGDLQRKDIERIDQSGKALLGILNDILDLSKIEAGKMDITTGPVDVRAVVREIDDLLRASVVEKGLTFEQHVEDAVPAFVRTDSLRLRQVLLNLAGNAVKFTERGGVTLRVAWEAPDKLAFDVQDTGIGIEPEAIPRLFEDFTQADASDARRFGGTGLGLGIARRLVRLLEGDIEASSVPGSGSRFTFTLNAEATEGAPSAPEGPVDARLHFEGRVLLAEDDRIARYVVGKLLDSHGCLVDTAMDGREAVAAIQTGAYDLVLMDCQMPVMDGYDATAQERALEGDVARTPIVAMTASVMQTDSERCTEVGMDDFLGKPIDPRRLQAILERFLRPGTRG